MSVSKTITAHLHFRCCFFIYYIFHTFLCSLFYFFLNPNNWLKSLSITGYSLTPTFQAEEEEDTVYNLIVDNSVESIEINAESVSTLASISGIGEIELHLLLLFF